MLQSVSLKIKTKLTYGIGLLFAMIVLLGGLSVQNIYRMSADTQNILADNYNTLLYSRRMLDALERIKTDPVARTEFEKNLNLQKENITEVDDIRIIWKCRKTTGPSTRKCTDREVPWIEVIMNLGFR